MAVIIDVREVRWDWRVVRHGRRHALYPYIGQAVMAIAPRYFENKPGRRGSHVAVGPDRTGRFWTISIERLEEEGVWRAVTGWPSKKSEIAEYNAGGPAPTEETEENDDG
jgi:hypothetical protein